MVMDSADTVRATGNGDRDAPRVWVGLASTTAGLDALKPRAIPAWIR